MSNWHDEWKATWSWAREIWGDTSDHKFNWFFGKVAQEVAESEGWEELGSSDVWHATIWMVEDAKRDGVTTRNELIQKVMDVSGFFHGFEEKGMLALYGEKSSPSPVVAA